MSSILAQSIPCCDTGGGPDIFKCGIPATPSCIQIPPATTLTVDILPTSFYKGAKWLVNVADVPFTRVASYEVYGINQNGIAANNTTYAILGQVIPHIVATSIVGSNMELQITNNDIVPINVCITRLPIPTSLGAAYIAANPPTSYVPIVRLIGDIDAGDSLIVDSVRYPKFKSVKWLISVTQPSTNKKRTFEVFSTFRNGTFVTHTTYGFMADLIDIDINVTQIGYTANLIITNNEATFVVVDVTRIPIMFDLPAICEFAPDGDVLAVLAFNAIPIPTTTTVSVDSVPYDQYAAIKWFVALTDPLTDRVMGIQVYATHRDGTLPIHTSYAIVGSFIDSVIDVIISGSDLVLRVQNNETVTITADIVRIPVSV